MRHGILLSVRYAAVYSFFLESLEPAVSRLKNFIEKASQATLIGDVFDDAATGQGLLNYFLRGESCGAISAAEVASAGLTEAELRTRSFLKILNMRRDRSRTERYGTKCVPRSYIWAWEGRRSF